MATLQKVRTCLWFDDQAEAALALYVSLFADGKITSLNRSGPENKVLTAAAHFGGQQVIGLNGGPLFPHTPAFSFSVICDDQAEVDRLWLALLENGGKPGQCGWLSDSFGVSWQIVPQRFYDLMDHPDPETRGRVFQAMLKMIKLDIDALEKAAQEKRNTAYE